MTLLLFPLAIFAGALIFAALSDAASMKISNRISLAIIIAFAIATPIAWESWAVFGEHMFIGLIFFVAGFIMFAVGGLGGGDAKLMSAIALWWTWPDVLPYIFYVTVLGAVLAIFMMVGRNFVPASIATNGMVSRMFSNEKQIPYGIALALGSLLVLPGSDIVQRVLTG